MRVVVTIALSASLIAAPVSATAAQVDALEPGLTATAPEEHSGGAAAQGSLATASGSLPTAGSYESERALILQQTNELRASKGLPALRLNAALNDIAQDWSVQQARTSRMSHRDGFHLLYPAGWSRAAENVAAGYSPSAVVGAWAGSSGHRANMLANHTDIGIGIAASSTGRLYYTQNFGRYSSTPPTPPGEVHRLSGSDRFATSAQISSRTFPSGASTVYVASGLDFPDALSAAALAGAADAPLLLVTRSSVPSVILRELRRLDPDRIVVAGGSGVVASSVISTLRGVTSRVDRVSGADRYDTSRRLALDSYGGTGAPVVYLATGAGYADALAAGPAAASVDAPVVLVAGASRTADAATLALLRQLGTGRVVIVGGSSAVSSGIQQSLVSAGLVVERISGTDRYATAALIAGGHFPDAPRSYLATGTGFADALSGGAAAGALGAPLFTVRPGCVPSPAHAALRSQNPDDLVLLGGLGALSPHVAGFYRC
ncbi:MAG: cell wall-binding repeat-containing protein [Microcella sp.]|uniref:cell wall-binding repeat-containing protein n=1 Tax=Microcella sp. TaxID=1913979 RepID=UPI0033146CD3